jgi:hypothetical protein
MAPIADYTLRQTIILKKESQATVNNKMGSAPTTTEGTMTDERISLRCNGSEEETAVEPSCVQLMVLLNLCEDD